MSQEPRWPEEGAEWPNRESSHFVESGGLRWHVQAMGSGPVILLLHGTGAATHSWRRVMPLLAANFTVVAPDLPGHGFTTGRPRGGLSLPSMANALANLCQAMDIDPALIVGHSAGAAIAMQLHLDGHHAGPIIGFNAALLPFPGLAAKLFPAMAKMLFVNPFAPRIFAGIARRSGEVDRFMLRATGSRIDTVGLKHYADLLCRSGHVAGAIGMMANWDLETLKRRLKEVDTPVLLVHGSKDGAVPPSAMREAAAMIAGAQTELLEGLGHLAHEEQPERAAALISKFATDHAIGDATQSEGK